MWQCTDCETQNKPQAQQCVVCDAAPRSGARPSPATTARRPAAASSPAVAVSPPTARPHARAGSPAVAVPPPFERVMVARPRRRTGVRLMPVILAAVVALPLTAAGYAALNSKDSAGTPLEQARAVVTLVQDSSRSRTAVKDAVVATKACRTLRANARAFTDAADARRGQRNQAGTLDMSALPSGAELSDSLLTALDHSERADLAFAAWATELAGGKCRKGGTTTDDFLAADKSSIAATAAKKRFVSLWNPIAQSHGLATFRYSDV